MTSVPAVCPECGGSVVRPFVYGELSPKVEAEVRQGRVVIGRPGPERAQWSCRICDHAWSIPEEPLVVRLAEIVSPAEWRTIPIARFPLTIGRQNGNDVQRVTGSVSRWHARIEQAADGYVVRDLGSTHGTFVNHKRVDVSCAVRHGDIISLRFWYDFVLLERPDVALLRAVAARFAACEFNPGTCPEGESWGASVEGCRHPFRYRCPARWDSLSQKPGDADPGPLVRHCASCKSDVRLCATETEAISRLSIGELVAFEREHSGPVN